MLSAKNLVIIFIALLVSSIILGFFISEYMEPEAEEEPATPEETPMTEEEQEPPEEGPEEEPEPTPSPETPKTQTKSGMIEQDETWSGEILITDTFEVPVGVTLIIEPGTKVMFKHYRHGYEEPRERLQLSVDGNLVAIGTPEEPIWFTSDAEEPLNGDWSMIHFYEVGNESIIKHAIVEFGEISLWNSSFTISNTIVRWGNAEGIYLESHCSPVIEYCRIYQNANNGIAMEQFNENAVVRYNEIFQNGQGGVHLMASSANMEHNVIRENKNGISLMDASFANLKYNTIEENEVVGIWLETGAPSANLRFNTIQDNTEGIGAVEFSQLSLNFNNIINRGKTEIDLEEESAGEINAKDNWWGTDDKTEIKDKMPAVAGVTIDYSPYLTKRVNEDPETGEQITQEIRFDYEDLRPYDLGYTPGDMEKDKYQWVFPDDETRRIVKRLDHGQEMPWSLAWDGEYLWMANNLGVFKLDPETGEVVKSFNQPGERPWGMTFDGEHLWINDFTTFEVYELDPMNGELLSSFSYGERYPDGLNGMAWDGEYLYLTGWTGPAGLVKFDRTGNVIEEILVETFVGGGLAFDGEYFWAQGTDEKIYKMEKTGEIIGWISSGSQTMFDLAWDGEYLWSGERTNEIWNDKKIFKLEILKVMPR